MPAEGTFYAPVGYSVWWPLAGVALVLICCGWYGWVWASTRPRAGAAVPGFIAPRNPDSVRRKYLGLVDAIEHQFDAGTLSEREAHLELSLAVRTFVHEMTGLHTQRMTLAQLKERQLPLVADAVERFYPGAFAAQGGQLSVGQATQSARDVVLSWR